MKEIKVMNRKDAINFSFNISDNKKYAIVSISEVDDSFPEFKNSSNIVSVLKVHFDDVDKNDRNCITENDALKIADFVKNVAPNIDILIVHCLAGRSRSAGCAAAISKWYFNDDSFYFKRYNPNMTVYRLVLNSLMND